jgi:hypothetical protein
MARLLIDPDGSVLLVEPGSALLIEFEPTVEDGLLLDDQVLVQVSGVQSRDVFDNLLVPDTAERIREKYVPADGLVFLEQMLLERVVAPTDAIVLPDQLVRILDHIEAPEGLLLGEQASAGKETIRELTDGLFLIELLQRVRENIIQNELLLFDPSALTRELRLLEQILLADDAVRQYFPAVVEALIGVRMGRADILGAQISSKRLEAAIIGSHAIAGQTIAGRSLAGAAAARQALIEPRTRVLR